MASAGQLTQARKTQLLAGVPFGMAMAAVFGLNADGLPLQVLGVLAGAASGVFFGRRLARSMSAMSNDGGTH